MGRLRGNRGGSSYRRRWGHGRGARRKQSFGIEDTQGPSPELQFAITEVAPAGVDHSGDAVGDEAGQARTFWRGALDDDNAGMTAISSVRQVQLAA